MNIRHINLRFIDPVLGNRDGNVFILIGVLRDRNAAFSLRFVPFLRRLLPGTLACVSGTTAYTLGITKVSNAR